MKLDELVAEVLKLSADDRRFFADRVLASLAEEERSCLSPEEQATAGRLLAALWKRSRFVFELGRGQEPDGPATIACRRKL